MMATESAGEHEEIRGSAEAGGGADREDRAVWEGLSGKPRKKWAVPRLANAAGVPWWRWRWVEGALLLALLWMLLEDRWRLCQEFLFQWTDEDQAIMWYGAYELLHGRVHEPCFFGQAYNSVLEGWLAVPLLWWGIRYAVAVPLVTVALGLLPFLMLAWAGWRRGQAVVAGLALAVPLILPTRYGMMTGMPRGFVTGVAVGAVSAVLLLPPAVRRTPMWWQVVAGRLWGKAKGRVFGGGKGVEPELAGRPSLEMPVTDEPSIVEPVRVRVRRSWPKSRYFLAALLAVVAVQLNPNVLVLLAPVALYAVLSSFLEWRFWVFGLLGLAAAAPYPWYVHKFYYEWHDDYRQYLRMREFTWSWDNYHKYIDDYIVRGRVFEDLVPMGTSGMKWLGEHPVPAALVWTAIVIGALMVLRLRIGGLLAAAGGVAFLMATFAYSRMTDGRPVISFPYDRMYLALPVLVVWLVMLVNWKPWPEWDWLKWARSRPVRWSVVGMGWLALAGLVWMGNWAVKEKGEHLGEEIAEATANVGIVQPVRVEDAEAGAEKVKALADKEKARLVIVGNGWDGKSWAYLLPELAGIETLLPFNERRTWRLAEESVEKGGKVILLASGGRGGRGAGPGGRSGARGGGRGAGAGGPGGRGATGAGLRGPMDASEGPGLTVADLGKHSAVYFAQQRGLKVRWFVPPAGADMLRQIGENEVAFPQR
jgi:hypothetical protein